MLKRDEKGGYQGRVCMIQAAGPSIYNHSQMALTFRKYIFDRFPINQIWDFSHLKRHLYLGAEVVSVALISGHRPLDSVQHTIGRTTYASKEKLYFDFDRYDFHWVARDAIGDSPYVWKTNLFGGGRFHDIVDRCQMQKSIGQFIKEHLTSGWYKGQGFSPLKETKEMRRKLLEGKNVLNEAESEELTVLRKDAKEANYLTGKPYFEKDSITGELICKGNVEHKYFTRRRVKKLFVGPVMLISETIPFPTKFIQKGKKAAYSDVITGIIAPQEDTSKLLSISDFLRDHARLCNFLVACVSSRYIIDKVTATNQNDLLCLPFVGGDSPKP